MLNLIISRGCFILVILSATSLSCSEEREVTSRTSPKNEIECRVVDQEIRELISVRATRAKGLILLDKAIVECPADSRRYHQRAMLSAILGDRIMEKKYMDLAIKTAEQSQDKCLLDLMLLEKKGLELRKPVVPELPVSCRNKKPINEG